MTKNKKLLVLLSMVLAFTLLVVGCSKPATPGNSDTPTPTKDTLIVGHGADAKSLDPHASNDQPSSRVNKQIYETLIVQNEAMELVPGLATKWTQIDELTYEFELKKGVKFHNGEELKASDVVFTFLRAIDSPQVSAIVGVNNPEKGILDPSKIVVIDDYKVQIGTYRPYGPLLTHLAHPAASILNEKAVNEKGADYGQNPVGTGPFMLSKWNTGDSIELVRFEEYHGTPAKVKNLIMRVITENANRTIELETGGVDIAYDIAAPDVKKVEENSNLIMLRDANLSTTYIGFNSAKGPFADVRVRQAVNYALDMDSIVEAVYLGTGSPAKGPLGPNIFGSNQSLKPYGYDVAKAKELMKEAGLENGFKTSIWTNENQLRMDIAEIAQNQLKEIGIEAEVKVMEFAAYLTATEKGEHDMFILGWGTVTGDPDYGLYPLFHSSQHGAAGNRTFYTNAEVDSLLEKGRTATDAKEREDAYKKAQEIIRDEAPWVFTWIGENLTGTAKNVKGFKQHPAGHHFLSGVYFE